MQITYERSPFPPGTTVYQQVGDPDGLGDDGLTANKAIFYGALAFGFVNGGFLPMLAWGLGARLAPRATLVVGVAKYLSDRKRR